MLCFVFFFELSSGQSWTRLLNFSKSRLLVYSENSHTPFFLGLKRVYQLLGIHSTRIIDRVSPKISCILEMKTLIRVNTSEPRTAAACHRYRRQIYRARGTPAAHHRYRTVPYRMRHLDRVHHRYHAGAVRPVFHHDSFHACSSQQAFTQGLTPFTSFFFLFPPPSLASLYCYTSVLQ